MTAAQEHPLAYSGQRLRGVSNLDESLVKPRAGAKVGNHLGTSNLEIFAFVLWHVRGDVPGEDD